MKLKNLKNKILYLSIAAIGFVANKVFAQEFITLYGTFEPEPVVEEPWYLVYAKPVLIGAIAIPVIIVAGVVSYIRKKNILKNVFKKNKK